LAGLAAAFDRFLEVEGAVRLLARGLRERRREGEVLVGTYTSMITGRITGFLSVTS
jgi:hypothetical protein